METEIEVVDYYSKRVHARLLNLTATSTVADLKRSFYNARNEYYVERQSFKIETRGRTLADNESLASLELANGGKIFFKDLGPQVKWTTVFLAEYAGPIFVYLIFYFRLPFIYNPSTKIEMASHVACFCWVTHYVKRLLETLFVHRFSHATMPRFNLFKNCLYYWGFTAFVAYFNNHPLYTPPADWQLYLGTACFLISEYGNFSIHIALRDLRPPGTRTRSIPYPTSNPMTKLFDLVSCPNYTYEFFSWLSYSLLSQSFPALIFSLVGLVQMSAWALNKHKAYKKEFSNYPNQRKAIIPFIL